MIKKMTTIEAVNMYEILLPLTQNNNRKFPGEITWAIYRSFLKVEEVNKSYREVQKRKVQEMASEEKATVFPNGGFTIPQEFVAEYKEFILPIEQSEIEVELHTITEESFNKLINYELSIPELAAIDILKN